MKRVLIDYKKLNHEVANLLIESYPYGYGDEDIITFKNQQGEIVEAVEIRTEDTVYLVKISKSLSNFIANFDDAIEKELVPKAIAPITTDMDMESDDEEAALLNLEPDTALDYDLD